MAHLREYREWLQQQIDMLRSPYAVNARAGLDGTLNMAIGKLSDEQAIAVAEFVQTLCPMKRKKVK